jgi:hypothetical protein
MIATHTARFDGGRGNELFIHASITTSPAYVCAMRNLGTISDTLQIEILRLQGHVSSCRVHGAYCNNEPNYTGNP